MKRKKSKEVSYALFSSFCFLLFFSFFLLGWTGVLWLIECFKKPLDGLLIMWIQREVDQRIRSHYESYEDLHQKIFFDFISFEATFIDLVGTEFSLFCLYNTIYSILWEDKRS